MDKMVNYIFGTLQTTETAIRHIGKSLQLQRMVNRRVMFFTVAATVNIVILAKTVREQSEQIKKLNDEIEKLKEPTESCKESTESKS